MSESIHTARWISQLVDQGWEIHLFPSIDYGRTHLELKNVTVHHTFYDGQRTNQNKVKSFGIPVRYRPLVFLGREFLKRIFPDYRLFQLTRLIKKIKPDIIHSMEIQAAGYLTLEAKKRLHGKFPQWIVTNWGSDIYLFGRLSEHRQRITEVLTACDYYSCECQRDVCLARAYGFSGKVLPVFPNTGGFDLNNLSRLRQAGQSSARRVIMLKGYQHWAGRALVGLRALERCVDLLREYEVVIYSGTPDVLIAAELFQESTGIKTTIIQPGTPHSEIVALHGKARISIGLSISDAISTSLLEAMVMGSLPIQSWTACADEWIEDGINGLLVPPEDPEIIELAIRRALTDDTFVDQASEKNYRLASDKLDRKILMPKAVEMYNIVANEKGHQ